MEFQNILALLKSKHFRLSKEDPNLPAVWYQVSSSGCKPSSRVGHSITWVNFENDLAESENKDSIYCIGGANPNGSFREVYALDLKTSIWRQCEAKLFKARYEHAAVSVTTPIPKILVFGGANEHGSLNDVQEFNLLDESWSDKSQCLTDGILPCPRTHHTNAVLGSDKLIVFGGGKHGSEPVNDGEVYIYEHLTSSWQCLKVKGDPPHPRQGHLVITVNKKIYVHGGMSGIEFFNDLYELDTDINEWIEIKCSPPVPCGRASHGGIGVDSAFLIFGGLTSHGVVSDLYLFHTERLQWTSVVYQGSVPSPRLDFAVTLIPVLNGCELPSVNDKDGKKISQCCFFLHGGMNLEGEIFDDAYVCYLNYSA